MRNLAGVLRGIIAPLGWICALLAVGTPIWFAIAALGTRWGFIDLATGLDWMTHEIGHGLLMACLATGIAGLVLIGVHGLVRRRLFGVVASPVLALAVGGGGIAWAEYIEQQRSTPPVLDITTDRQDPPHFSHAFAARRPASDESLTYQGKQAGDGRALGDVQAAIYPEIATVHVARAPDTVFAEALDYAYARRWRIGTASRSAGMFEAVTESVWYGLHDDIVVRIRDDGQGGSLVDIRSLARQPVHDLGRNARRVLDFSEAMQSGEGAR